jgi:DNA processing protein
VTTRQFLEPREPAAAAELRAWLDLQQALVFAPQRAITALQRTCDARQRNADAQERTPDPRAACRIARVSPASAAQLDAVERRLRELDAVAVPWGWPAYPERLARLPDAPPLLLVRGAVRDLTGPSVAIVGSRAATAYGRATSELFADALARAGYGVVSGLARGIDGVAHEAALAAGGRTLAVMASGPEQVYPRQHRGLAERITASGALLTEFPPGTPPRAPYFPLRNRIISALCVAVVVVEARERSGSLVTAGLAAGQGVDVWAVPGPVDAATSRGTNRLLREGAGVATDPGVLLEELARSGPVPEPLAVRRLLDAGEDPEPARRILVALAEGPLTRDALARRLRCAGKELALELFELELSGRVVEDRDGRLRVVSG